jgi:PadR family transcriptional regulator AphA
MDYQVKHCHDERYLSVGGEAALRAERDALDLIAACHEHDTRRVMVFDAALPDEFFRLGTGLAGAILQKLANYRVRSAFVIANGRRAVGKSRDLLAELCRRTDIRAFTDAAEAENWLVQS